MSKNRIGFQPPRKRHILVENVDKDGKPLGHYTCLTCQKEAQG